MPDLKISQMPSATLPLSGFELIPVVQGGLNKKTTLAELAGVPGRYYWYLADRGNPVLSSAASATQLSLLTLDSDAGLAPLIPGSLIRYRAGGRAVNGAGVSRVFSLGANIEDPVATSSLTLFDGSENQITVSSPGAEVSWELEVMMNISGITGGAGSGLQGEVAAYLRYGSLNAIQNGYYQTTSFASLLVNHSLIFGISGAWLTGSEGSFSCSHSYLERADLL